MTRQDTIIRADDELKGDAAHKHHADMDVVIAGRDVLAKRQNERKK